MASARSTVSRPRKPVAEMPAEQATESTEQATEPRLRALKPSGGQSVPPLDGLRELQRRAVAKDHSEDTINVRLCIDGSDADGVRFFDELLPVSLVRALIDPAIANFFIPVRGDGRTKPPRARGHWLHTQYIREIILLDELPEERA
jgi:hypothetical protein